MDVRFIAYNKNPDNNSPRRAHGRVCAVACLCRVDGNSIGQNTYSQVSLHTALDSGRTCFSPSACRGILCRGEAPCPLQGVRGVLSYT